MLRDDAVDRIQRRLSFRENLETPIIEALQDAQERLEQEAFLPWFLVTEVSSISTADGEERVPLPSGFIRELETEGLQYFNSSATEDDDVWTELAKDDTDFLRRKYPGEGAPIAYALDADYFRIFPTPDDTYTLKMQYFAKDTVLSTNIENAWLANAAWWLIGEAGADIAGALEHEKAEARFAAQALSSRERVRIDTEARMHSNRKYVMGGSN